MHAFGLNEFKLQLVLFSHKMLINNNNTFFVISKYHIIRAGANALILEIYLRLTSDAVAKAMFG